jgi:alkaline phosphatase D
MSRYLVLLGLLLILILSAAASLFETSYAANIETEEAKTIPAERLAITNGLQQSDELQITHGPISGEVSATAVTLWARGNVTGTLAFTLSSTAAFTDTLGTGTADITPAADFIGKARLTALTPGTRYHYNVTLTDGENASETVAGEFQTAPDTEVAAPFNFTFGGDIGGQNFCRTVDGGWDIFQTMTAEESDFFIMTGDSVYVDNACDGDNNVSGAEGAYRDLDGFRTRYRYSLEDEAYAEFLAKTAVYVTWDDHEIINDFGGPALNRINPQLFADGQQAYFEYWPVAGVEEEPYRLYRQVAYGAHADFFILDTRSYRDPNVDWDPNPNTLELKSMLGEEQFAWLQEGLMESTATWKFIVSSVPLSYPTGFPQPQVDGRDGWANFTEKSGYEGELLALTFYILNHNIENVVFLTGDVHWPHAISYDPDRDGTADFMEFSAGPISAITLPPAGAPDPTLNPTVLYAEGEFMGDFFNFGKVAVDEEGMLTYTVIDGDGESLYELSVSPVE